MLSSTGSSCRLSLKNKDEYQLNLYDSKNKPMGVYDSKNKPMGVPVYSHTNRYCIWTDSDIKKSSAQHLVSVTCRPPFERTVVSLSVSSPGRRPDPATPDGQGAVQNSDGQGACGFVRVQAIGSRYCVLYVVCVCVYVCVRGQIKLSLEVCACASVATLATIS